MRTKAARGYIVTNQLNGRTALVSAVSNYAAKQAAFTGGLVGGCIMRALRARRVFDDSKISAHGY